MLSRFLIIIVSWDGVRYEKGKRKAEGTCIFRYGHLTWNITVILNSFHFRNYLLPRRSLNYYLLLSDYKYCRKIFSINKCKYVMCINVYVIKAVIYSRIVNTLNIGLVKDHNSSDRYPLPRLYLSSSPLRDDIVLLIPGSWSSCNAFT